MLRGFSCPPLTTDHRKAQNIPVGLEYIKLKAPSEEVFGKSTIKARKLPYDEASIIHSLMHFWHILSFLTCVCGLNERPLPLSKDPFYFQPTDLHRYELGDIIRVREAPSNLRTLYMKMNVKNVWQFGIRSEDGFGNPQAVFSTLVEPHNADNTKILSYQFGQDSSLIDCSPSYALLSGATEHLSLYTESEAIGVEWALSKGWYVNIPNHEGPHAAFCVGPQGGRALLDSLKAALASGEITGIKPSAKIAMWGFSGGTVPTGWAATLLPDYAPQLESHIVGASVGGWVVNVTATAEASDGTPFAGLIPNAINGILHEYPHARLLIYDNLTTKRAKQFESSQNMCLFQSILAFLNTRFFSGDDPWFHRKFDILTQPGIQRIVEEISLGLNENVSVPAVPFHIFQSVSDDVVPYAPAQKLYEKFCRDGAKSVEFYQMQTPDHVLSFVEGIAPSMLWIEERFFGAPPVKGCKKIIRPEKHELFGAGVPYKKIIKLLWALITKRAIGAVSLGENMSISLLKKFSTKTFWDFKMGRFAHYILLRPAVYLGKFGRALVLRMALF